jgi:hypothetical protein
MRHRIAQLLFSLLLAVGNASAETGVEGRYLSADVSDVRILLTIQAPPPKAFIVLHRIPPGVTMTGASPTPSGFHQDGTTVKWLFKRPPPGSIMLTMQLSRQVPENQLEGEIRYRHPASGSLVVRTISR